MLNFANIETTNIGNKNLIPKTAIKIPQVKNLILHLWLIFSSFIALTTALSKDRLTSKIPRTIAMNTQVHPVPPWTCSPQKYAPIRPAIVTMYEPKKYSNIGKSPLILFNYI